LESSGQVDYSLTVDLPSNKMNKKNVTDIGSATQIVNRVGVAFTIAIAVLA